MKGIYCNGIDKAAIVSYHNLVSKNTWLYNVKVYGIGKASIVQWMLYLCRIRFHSSKVPTDGVDKFVTRIVHACLYSHVQGKATACLAGSKFFVNISSEIFGHPVVVFTKVREVLIGFASLYVAPALYNITMQYNYSSYVYICHVSTCIVHMCIR